MNRCVIITSYQSALLKESFDFTEGDYVICADGGYSYARAEEIDPDIVIGDFDSIGLDYIEADLKRSGLDSRCRIARVPAEKDDTDTLICLKYGIEFGFEEFFILGGLGGRLDHTLANLQTMSYGVDQQKTVWFLDGKNRATLRSPGALTVKNPGDFMISLFAFGESCEGVTIRGVKYPLDHYLMTDSFPIGVSNEFAGEEAEISHASGKLLIILSRD
ncbi:MAG TPA: thiamine diphosphokinase [Bacillota bacterium]|nr:thiamine diphosphokinase [Bacillota bacterium]